MNGSENQGEDPAIMPNADASVGQTPLDIRRLALGDEDRLPWLGGDDEDHEEGVIDVKRVIALVAAALLMLAALVSGVWWVTHRHQAGAPAPDGSLVAAPEGPYKVPPKSPGGKTYEGTGDTSFAVSQGQLPVERLADGGSDGAPATGADYTRTGSDTKGHVDSASTGHGKNAKPVATPVAPSPHASDNSNDGIAQIGAYSSQLRAETAWTQLSQNHHVLAGVRHRVIAGQIDSGTVYRLQILTTQGGANALCVKLKGDSLACQVKQ